MNITEIDKNKCIRATEIVNNDEDTLNFVGEILLQKEIFIKVTRINYNRDAEKIYKILQNHEYFNIVPIYGFTKCKDDFKTLKLRLLTEGICTATDNKNIYLLLMKKIEKSETIKNTLKSDLVTYRKEIASIFFQILLTSFKLYRDYKIVHTDIKLDNYEIINDSGIGKIFDDHNETMREHNKDDNKVIDNSMYYSIHGTACNIDAIVKLFNVRVYIIDYDNGIILDDDKNYLFIEDIINTVNRFFNNFSIIDKSIYDKIINRLHELRDISKNGKFNCHGLIYSAYKVFKRYLFPVIGEGVIQELDFILPP